jgi:NADH:ubiquinone oxidoreductase subunit C
MQHILPGGRLSPLPDAVEAQRKFSRTAFELISTGSTLHHESTNAARAMSNMQFDAIESVTGLDLQCAHSRVDDRFESVQNLSDRAEDRFLTTVLSMSQLTATYAETFDDAVARVIPSETDESD